MLIPKQDCLCYRVGLWWWIFFPTPPQTEKFLFLFIGDDFLLLMH